jgi:hypothetical protein
MFVGRQNILFCNNVIVIGSLNCRGFIADSVKRCDIFTKYKDLYEVTVLVNTHGIIENEKK